MSKMQSPSDPWGLHGIRTFEKAHSRTIRTFFWKIDFFFNPWFGDGPLGSCFIKMLASLERYAHFSNSLQFNQKSWAGHHVARRGRKTPYSNKMSVSFESDELFKKSLSYVGSSRAGPAPSQGLLTISILQKNTRIAREWRAFQKILMIFYRSDGF